MAARSGLEPKQTESESVVLPLHHRASPVKNESTSSNKQCHSKIQEKILSKTTHHNNYSHYRHKILCRIF